MFRRSQFAAVGIFASVCALGRASAADSISDRHAPYLLSPTQKPAGVPANYVLTHSGFFHPSCVVTVRSDEVVGADRVIRGLDGTEHARFEPCAYPRYERDGRPSAPAHAPSSVQPAAALYDGYILLYSYYGSLPVGPTLTTDWTVPLAPTKVNGQDIAFFNGIQTNADGSDILQPVLDFNGESLNKWAIESEHCCISGNDMQTTPVNVNAGDQIRGTVIGTNCASTGVCQSWAVTTADITTGKSTTLNTTAPGGVPNTVMSGALETYGVTSCDMFPASNTITFANNVVSSASGTANEKYNLEVLPGANAEVPRNCGYSGSVAGDNYTLVWGAVTQGGAGGANSTGGATGSGGATSTGGRGGSASGGSSNGGSTSGGAAGHGGSSNGGAAGVGGGLGSGGAGRAGANGASGSNGAAGSNGVAGSNGASGSNGAAGSNGVAGSNGSAGLSGAPGSAGASAAGSAEKAGSGSGGSATGGSASSVSSSGTTGNQPTSGSADDNSGCSCSFERAGTRGSFPNRVALALVLAGLALVRRRRETHGG